MRFSPSERQHPAGRSAGFQPAIHEAGRLEAGGPAAWKAALRGATRWLLTLFLLAPIAFANIVTSSITGRVTVSGNPAEGVTVTAESPSLQQPRTTLSGPRGTYWLGALPPGEYDVTFTLPGHTTVTRRAIAEPGRVARSDATLEPNEDEESVTSTATTPNVTETTAITTHFDDATLDRLPLGRRDTPSVAPGIASGTRNEIDGIQPLDAGLIVAEDLIEQTTVVRGAASVEYDTLGGSVIAVRTRRGSETLSFSLRDTLTNSAWNDDGPYYDPWKVKDAGVLHMLESTVGGRIVPAKLWFFAAAWGGDRGPELGNLRAFNAKLQGQAGGAHHLEASFIEVREYWLHSSLWLQHSAVAGPRFTWETQVDRSSSSPSGALYERRDSLTSRASHVLPTRIGDHVLSAGITLWEESPLDGRSFFVSDRWSSSRWVVAAGIRSDDTPRGDAHMPRIAVTYDLTGLGRGALTASHGEYPSGFSPQVDPGMASMRMTTLGYAAALGRSGSARIDYFRRNYGSLKTDSLELDARYRIFDRFEVGGTYTYNQPEWERYLFPRNTANLWLGMELPLGEHELGITLVQRSREVVFEGRYQDFFPTDLGLRYAIQSPRVRLTLAAEMTNFLLRENFPMSLERTLRFWVRVSS